MGDVEGGTMSGGPFFVTWFGFVKVSYFKGPDGCYCVEEDVR